MLSNVLFTNGFQLFTINVSKVDEIICIIFEAIHFKVVSLIIAADDVFFSQKCVSAIENRI